jgi:hypothetical protein
MPTQGPVPPIRSVDTVFKVKFYRYLILGVLLVGCSKTTPVADTNTPTSESSIKPTDTTVINETTSDYKEAMSGLLAVDSSTGDVFQKNMDDTWTTLFDGPGYDSEAYAYAESALSVEKDSNVVISMCCEPVVGSLSTLNKDGSLNYVGYGTRPSLIGTHLVAFKDLFEDSLVSSLYVMDLSKEPRDGYYESREILLKGVVNHGMRLVGVGPTKVALTWSETNSPSSAWYLSVVDLSTLDEVDLLNLPKLELPSKMDLVATNAGMLQVFEHDSNTTFLYDVFYKEDAPLDSVPITKKYSLPGKSFSVAAKDSWVFVLADDLYAVSETSKIPMRKTTLSWIGW